MDTTKTRAQLVEMAAEELGICNANTSLEAEDAAKIDGRLDGLLGELAARGVVDVSADNDIESTYCGALAQLLANECASVFGAARKSEAERTVIEDRLKVIDQRQPPSKPLLEIDRALQGRGGHLTSSRWSRGY